MRATLPTEDEAHADTIPAPSRGVRAPSAAQRAVIRLEWRSMLDGARESERRVRRSYGAGRVVHRGVPARLGLHALVHVLASPGVVVQTYAQARA